MLEETHKILEALQNHPDLALDLETNLLTLTGRILLPWMVNPIQGRFQRCNKYKKAQVLLSKGVLKTPQGSHTFASNQEAIIQSESILLDEGFIPIPHRPTTGVWTLGPVDQISDTPLWHRKNNLQCLGHVQPSEGKYHAVFNFLSGIPLSHRILNSIPEAKDSLDQGLQNFGWFLPEEHDLIDRLP